MGETLSEIEKKASKGKEPPEEGSNVAPENTEYREMDKLLHQSALTMCTIDLESLKLLQRKESTSGVRHGS